ncbi:MAG: Rpn family recombination-promoting nuclease/putative transposase [Candidatus Gracilibacteria bacterium]|nr:Rpn family recombination-promoting nuclease/putative transposase [Candidatus Gracilibacteria bacterium]
MRYLDPKNDVAFKKIFADENHKEILIHFLNSILDLDAPIKEVTILRHDQLPEIKDLKETSLDLKAKDEKNREFIIEMQVEKQKDFMNRALYYAAKSYSKQIKKADFYDQLNPVIFLGILDFNLFDGEDFLTQHYIVNKQTGNRDMTHLEFSFIELPKFNKTEKQCENLADKWIYFMKNADDLKFIPENIKSEEIKTAYEISEQFGWTEGELELYESRDRAVAAQKDKMNTAREEGLEKGREEGLEKGREEGREEGIEKGREEGEKNKELELISNLMKAMSISKVEAKKILKINK